MNVADIIDSKQISPKDSREKIKKDILFQFDQMKMNNPKMKSEEIAVKLGYSLSTINRYRRDLGDIQRTRKKISSDKQREINIKTMDTRMKNKMFDEEIKALRKQNLPIEEYEAKQRELREKYLGRKVEETNYQTPVIKTVKSKKAGKGDCSLVSTQDSEVDDFVTKMIKQNTEKLLSSSPK